MAVIQAKDIAAIFDTLRDQRDKARAETEELKHDLFASRLLTQAAVDELEATRDQRDEVRAETARVLFELVACQDQRAALRAQVELLKRTVGAGLLDYEANDVLNDLEEARAEITTLRAIAENLRERYYDGAKPGWTELKQYLDETAEPSSIQHGHL